MTSPNPSDLRVPKLRVPVELALRGEPPSAFELFVPEREDHGWRREDVCALLESSVRFLPVFERAPGAYLVLQKAAVQWVRLLERPPGEDPFASEDALYDKQERVRVGLEGGASLEGDLLYSPAPGHARVADFLNEPGAFFSLWTDDGEALVAKAHVVRVTELR